MGCEDRVGDTVPQETWGVLSDVVQILSITMGSLVEQTGELGPDPPLG